MPGPCLTRWLSGTADLLFPPVCNLCGTRIEGGSRGVFLCTRCVSELTGGTVKPCLRCARPLPTGTKLSPEGCPHCRDKRFRFERVWALGVYEGLRQEAVLRMKQSTGEALALSVGTLLGRRLRNDLREPPDFVVAVPTHWTRRLTRSAVCPDNLLERVCQQLGTRPCRRLLRCRRRTRKQGTLLPTERYENVRGAYAASASYAIDDARVLVVDDVMTTGATANEVAKVLRQAGAKSVSLAVVARGIGFDG